MRELEYPNFFNEEIKEYKDMLDNIPLDKLSSEKSKLMVMHHRYLNSFVDEENFVESKRFSRYIEKSKAYIVDNMLKQLYAPMFEYSRDSSDFGLRVVKTVDDFIINAVYCHYYAPSFESERRNDMRVLFDQMFGHCVNAMPIEHMDGDLLKDYFKGITNAEIKDEFTPIEQCVAEEYQTAAMQFIREKALRMRNIDSSNYFLTLPDCFADAMRLIELTMNLVRSDIEIMYDYYVVKKEFKEEHQKELQEMEKMKDDLKRQREENEAELQKAKTEIARLNTQLTQKTTAEEDVVEGLRDENNTLLQQNTKLTKRYESLLTKYNRLKESQVDNTEDEKKIETEEIKELDMNGKYAFVLYEDSKFIDNIKREFPNAILIHTNTNIKSMNIDLVVFVSTQVHHSTYFGIKNQCRDNNIPFISCGNSNINILKEIMRNELCI